MYTESPGLSPKSGQDPIEQNIPFNTILWSVAPGSSWLTTGSSTPFPFNIKDDSITFLK